MVRWTRAKISVGLHESRVQIRAEELFGDSGGHEPAQDVLGKGGDGDEDDDK